MKQICVCVLEPMGVSGLEGYNSGSLYECERREKDKNGRPYYRVWPEGSEKYYETCGTGTFKKFFKVKV